MKNLVVVGAGTAGTMIANKLVQEPLLHNWQISVVDRDRDHLYQPGLLFVPFGGYSPAELVRKRPQLLRKGIRFFDCGFEGINTDSRMVELSNGKMLPFDVLVIATGTVIAPEKTEGLTATGWKESIFDFYTLDGATALAEKLDTFPGGTLAVNVVEMPIKCPVAPLEFLFLADAFFEKKGNRAEVELVYATPLDAAFTKPRAAAHLGQLLEEKNIAVVPDFNLESVDGGQKTMTAFDGRTQEYDLLVTIPTHTGAPAILTSDLSDPMGFVPTHRHTLQTLAHENIFCLGDATDLPTSKAGSVAHFQAEVLAENILRFIQKKSLSEAFDGHANCFIETGHDKALLIDFNYETEPLPGKFPLPGVGPFSLLSESHINHWGKLAFKWIYWNKLLPGDALPIGHEMVLAGKWQQERNHV